jgi:hypothetical protein
MRQLPSADFVDHRKEAPIVLVGAPSRISGRIALVNRADQRVVLQQARLTGAPLARAAGAKAVAQDVPVRLTAVLSPNERAQVAVKVAIDQHTPPGRYAAELALGDRSYPVQLHVTEHVELQVAPERIVVENRAGRQRKQAILHNHGNVPLRIGNIGAVVLDEELIACKTLRAMLAESGEAAKTIDDWISSYLRQGGKQLEAVGMLWVELEGAPVELAPGETASVELTVRVPDSLDPRSRYEGVVFLYDDNLRFVVVPTGADKRGPEIPSPPARRPAPKQSTRRRK